MARLRTLKPGFFTNEELADLEPLTRLLFPGLWCLADRAGRLEDRPRKIKAEVLPYDDCDVDRMLADLHERGFIIRYEAEGKQYIQITNFRKHQTPHIKEAPSTIPAPPDHSSMEGEHHTNTVPAPDKHSTSTSGNLVIGNREVGSGDLGVGTGAAPSVALPAERVQPRAVPKPRKRSEELYEALTDELGQPATESERETYRRAVRELCAVGAKADEIRLRAGRYRTAWPNVELTPAALLKHWSRFAEARPAAGNGRASPPLNRVQQREQQILAEREEALRRINGRSEHN